MKEWMIRCYQTTGPIHIAIILLFPLKHPTLTAFTFAPVKAVHCTRRVFPKSECRPRGTMSFFSTFRRVRKRQDGPLVWCAMISPWFLWFHVLWAAWHLEQVVAFWRGKPASCWWLMQQSSMSRVEVESSVWIVLWNEYLPWRTSWSWTFVLEDCVLLESTVSICYFCYDHGGYPSECFWKCKWLIFF